MLCSPCGSTTDAAHGITDRVVCSLPSAPVLVRWAYVATYKPKVIPLPADAFLVVLPGKVLDDRKKENHDKINWDDDDALEFRVFIVPKDALEQIAPGDHWDKRYLAEHATPTSYVTLFPKKALKHAKDALGRVEELNSDDQKKRNGAVESPHPIHQGDLSDLTTNSIVAYYGPYAIPPGIPDENPVTIGGYRDSFGAPIDLARSEYKVAVLIVVKKLKRQDGDGGSDVLELPETIPSEWETIPSTGPKGGRNPAKK